MNKEKLKNYLENKIPNTHENNITDNNDRLVWMSDVIDVVNELVNTSKIPSSHTFINKSNITKTYPMNVTPFPKGSRLNPRNK